MLSIFLSFEIKEKNLRICDELTLDYRVAPKDETSETTVRNLYCLFSYFFDFTQQEKNG